jgi:hypothetical protein
MIFEVDYLFDYRSINPNIAVFLSDKGYAPNLLQKAFNDTCLGYEDKEPISAMYFNYEDTEITFDNLDLNKLKKQSHRSYVFSTKGFDKTSDDACTEELISFINLLDNDYSKIISTWSMYPKKYNYLLRLITELIQFKLSTNYDKALVCVNGFDITHNDTHIFSYINALTKFFHNVQFFIETQSPLLLTTVPHNSQFIVINDEEVEMSEKNLYNVGFDVYNYLEQSFRSEEVSKLINEIPLLIVGRKFNEASLKLNELSSINSDLPQLPYLRTNLEIQILLDEV